MVFNNVEPRAEVYVDIRLASAVLRKCILSSPFGMALHAIPSPRSTIGTSVAVMTPTY